MTSHAEQMLRRDFALRPHRRVAFIGVWLRLIQWRNILAGFAHRIGLVLDRRDVVWPWWLGWSLWARRLSGRHLHQLVGYFHLTAPFGLLGANADAYRKVVRQFQGGLKHGDMHRGAVR